MGFLYTISNIFVPILLLSFKTLEQFNKTTQINYGIWAIFIVFMFIFNFLNCIFYDSFIILLLDLAIKCLITFIPKNINDKIVQKITNLHLEIILDQFRLWFINYYLLYHWKLTNYSMKKMYIQEQKQFQQALINRLNGQNDEKKTFIKQDKSKIIFVNTGVMCDLIKQENQSVLNKSNEKSLKKNIHNQTFGNILPPTKEHKIQYKQAVKQQIKEQLPKFNYKKQYIEKRNINHNIVDLKKSRQTVPFKSNNVKFQYSTNKKLTHQTFQLKRSSTFMGAEIQQIQPIRKTKKPYKEDGQTADLLNVSASQYSDMFDSDDQRLNDRQLQCKTQAILQIGIGAHIRLQIYNLELYSNSDLRIVSLYGRQFQQHKLVSIKALPNGYYQLKFSGESKIQTRKIKFRGNYQPFIKYMLRQ